MMPTTKPKFAEGDKVLCHHGSMIYEAKCLKVEAKEKDIKYYVHYSGWNKGWDEWVPECRVLKYNEQNLTKQQDLKRQYDSHTRKSGKRKAADDIAGGSREASRESSRERSKRQKNQSSWAMKGFEDQDFYEIRMPLPEILKQKLIENAQAVADRKLSQLPANPTVSQVLDDYCDSVAETNPASARTGVSSETAKGLQRYFNETLTKQLLYKFEQPQNAEILKSLEPGADVSTIYGADHLLRLFVKLRGYLSFMTLECEDFVLLSNQLEEFLKYLEKNEEHLFRTQYYLAPEEYCQQVDQ